MKRYDHYGTLEGGGPAEAIEEPDGDWVMYDDAQAAIAAAVAAERERNADLCDAVASVCAESCNGARKAAAVATAKSCARLIRGA